MTYPLALRGPSAPSGAARSAFPSRAERVPVGISHPARRAPACLSGQRAGRQNCRNEGRIEVTELHLPEQMRQDITMMRIVKRRSLREIGAAYGHCEHWAKQRCRAIGLPARINLDPPPHRRPRRPVEDILALRARGLSMTEIGRALGLTKNQVAGRLWRAGECQPKGNVSPMLDFVALVERIPQTGCRYIAAPEPHLHEGMYCGKPCLVVERSGQPERSSYCAEHHARTHLRPAPLPAEARHAD